MRNYFLGLALAVSTWPAVAAERQFNFGEFPLNEPPKNFRSIVAGEGKPGDWKIIEDEAPSAMRSLTPGAPTVSKHPVLAQLSTNPTDEHFPILLLGDESYGDFTLTTRFKIVSGVMEQMAGVAFRIQDEKNFYVVRASALGNNLRFYAVVNGERQKLVGPEVEIGKGVWHELKVQCKGNQILSWLDGKALIPPLTDNSFLAGKIGFWTKSDSVSYFGDTQLTYTPREPFAQVMVREVLKEYPSLMDLKIFLPTDGQPRMRVIAGKNESENGQPGTEIEERVFDKEAIFQAKNTDSVTVVMPLRDRNGETVAAAQMKMETFLGQTEQNALARALPVVKSMQARIHSAKDLSQ